MTRLVNLALVLTLCTIVLGAYTRLTDAGLGCPDWPGCYGFLAAPNHPEQIEQAQERYPDSAVVPHKARNEMLHRYVAGTLGIVILSIFILSLWQRKKRILGCLLLLLVVMQAALGMLTVTLNLLPLIVLGHLLGAFALLSLLALLRVRSGGVLLPSDAGLRSLRPLACCALLMLVVQVSLGVWISANYAALACHQLPVCEPGWQKNFDVKAAFYLPMGHDTYEYGVLSHNARMSIHIMHRIGAAITSVLVGTLAFVGWRRASTRTARRFASALGILLVLQIALGLINVIAWLPLLNALAHNFVAANLLMLMVVFVDYLYRQVPQPAPSEQHQQHIAPSFNAEANRYSP